MNEDVAVIVGRFQCSSLHEGHIALFNYVLSKGHQRVLVFVGQTPLKGEANDPLDFGNRRAMIEDEYPMVEVHRIDDVFDPPRWSRNLDAQIEVLIGPGQKPVLYGSRDSFLKDYSGRFPTQEVPEVPSISSTQLRRMIGIKPEYNEDFRKGAIWSAQNRFPAVYATVDMAVVDMEKDMVLLARRPNTTLWRFPSGFSDVISSSFEGDAIRELVKETTLVAEDIEYVGSQLVDDPRYRSQVNKIKTLLFAITKWTGIPTPSDDLSGGELAWFSLENITPVLLVPNHRILLEMVREWYVSHRVKHVSMALSDPV